MTSMPPSRLPFASWLSDTMRMPVPANACLHPATRAITAVTGGPLTITTLPLPCRRSTMRLARFRAGHRVVGHDRRIGIVGADVDRDHDDARIARLLQHGGNALRVGRVDDEEVDLVGDEIVRSASDQRFRLRIRVPGDGGDPDLVRRRPVCGRSVLALPIGDEWGLARSLTATPTDSRSQRAWAVRRREGECRDAGEHGWSFHGDSLREFYVFEYVVMK